MNKLLLSVLFVIPTSIYSLHFTTSDGINTSLASFRGKKILIVNTAGGSRYASQYGSLERLYEKYKDSLAIIAFPSDDFGNEKASEMEIKKAVSSTYQIHYLLAAKTSVSGESISPVFRWLSSYSLNGVMDNPVAGDFFKYLIDRNGNIVGVFSGSVDPMDSVIQNAITN